ncbi:salivary secreted angiopoietin [Culex quinquefasciatus]|uniref:Salivary secreted angiopoietin n=1 Tax=Culex quinquefasciatus TaxID=7176 RepID=B0X0H7_CULQU|nr:salivary secreted angiopoietin [Culex quinquefasciatus]|eukprot:XP_001863149.1 salivary secreted angiopoietin [Culex quinquefasciatus]
MGVINNMKSIVFILAIVALLPFEVSSNETSHRSVLLSRLDELFVESSEQVEQLLTELYHLRQSVEHVAWLTNRVERAVQKVQLDNDVLVRNVSLLTSQTDNIILNQQYCANHEALKNLFFELTPKCLGNQTVPPIPTPSIATTTEAAEISTIPCSPDNFIVYERCTQAPPRSGVYRLRRQDGIVFSAFCEQELFGGGLLVFQSRLDGSVDFNRSWSEFVEGFGDPAGEYWLGLETLHQVAPNATDLVVAMTNFSDVEVYEQYSRVWFETERTNYRIRIGERGTGTAGDSFYIYYSEDFSTYDHFSNIAQRACITSLASGFWHHSCNTARERNNLNGIYGRGKGAKGIWWGTFGNLTAQNTSPLKSVQMMIRN